ncbi:MAG: prepilin peptidase [Candidatus Omnitrophica bacterium]|nr:prepilin peptidase [Candidatus Omnitrophota bacterium]
MLPLILFAFGAIVGSFLNVCILRLPKEESVVFPGSHCMACGKPVAWRDNVPLVSFFVLKGKCRSCGRRISRQYFVVELATALLFAGFFYFFTPPAKAAVYLAMTLALLVESVIDWRHKIIPDEITFPGILFGIVASAFFPVIHGEFFWARGFAQALIGAALGAGLLIAVGTLAELVMKKEAMGGGDVKLLAMIGAVVGWQGVLWTVFVSSLVGTGVGLYLRVKKGEAAIPFGPFLAIGAFLYLFFGKEVIAWYLGIL